MKKSMAENWPAVDYKDIIARIKIVEEAAEDFTEFEVEFLTEILRQARRFLDTFRMTPKQLATLQEIEDRVLLPRRIAAKIRKKSEKEVAGGQP